MYVYTTGQWVLLFFFYCLCGWIWESCYVSLRQRHWVNRGFLQGPLLPIYGSGAVIILVATIPVADDLRRFREKTELDAILFRARVREELEEHREVRAERRRHLRERVESNHRRLTSAKPEALQTLAEALETCRTHLDSLSGDEQDLAKRRAELDALLLRVRNRRDSLRNPAPAACYRSLRILRGNPSAVARDFSEALDSLRKLGERK